MRLYAPQGVKGKKNYTLNASLFTFVSLVNTKVLFRVCISKTLYSMFSTFRFHIFLMSKSIFVMNKNNDYIKHH